MEHRINPEVICKWKILPIVAFHIRLWYNKTRAVSRNNEKKGIEGKAEDTGGLTPVKDGNVPLRFLDRRTFLMIFRCCSYMKWEAQL